jgi:hypothetical protein
VVNVFYLYNSGIMNYLQGNLILRYLTNQCTSEECEELNIWLRESPQNENTLNYLKGQVSLI